MRSLSWNGFSYHEVRLGLYHPLLFFTNICIKKNTAFGYYTEPMAFRHCRHHDIFDRANYPLERNVTSCAMPNFFSSFIFPLPLLARWRLIFCAMASYFQLRGGVSRFRSTHKDVEGEELCQSSSMSHPHSHCMCVCEGTAGEMLTSGFKAEAAIPLSSLQK